MYTDVTSRRTSRPAHALTLYCSPDYLVAKTVASGVVMVRVPPPTPDVTVAMSSRIPHRPERDIPVITFWPYNTFRLLAFDNSGQ